jgi:hypothetical protein
MAASTVKDHAEVSVTVSVPKLSKVAAMVLRKIENSSHERNVRSAAK